MKIAIVDIEGTGLDELSCDMHCGAIHRMVEGNRTQLFDNTQLREFVGELNKLIADGWVIAGHNVIEYDFPVLRRYGMNEIPEGQKLDTRLVSRACYPGKDLLHRDLRLLKRRPELKEDLDLGFHSLKSWGLRLDCPKDDYDGGWEEYNEDMLHYCGQDTRSNGVLLDFLLERIPLEAALLETEVGDICREMRLDGVEFDRASAEGLTVTLAARRGLLTQQLKAAFPAWVEPTKEFTPKRTQKRKHFRYENGKLVEHARMVAGVTFMKGKEVEFNPASTDHIARCLIAKYGWKPKAWTDGGKPQVTADVLKDLKYPEAPALAEYQEIKKILGYLSEGQNAWLQLEQEGRIHGKVQPTGTVSGRAAHSRPNTGNVPSRTDLGHQCRGLFVAKPGSVLVGADASGLQLRILAHYLAKWDGGEFARQCEDGDIHEFMREATGLYTRAYQKTWTYAKLFGAAEPLLGNTTLDDWHAAYEQGLTGDPPPKRGAARRLGRQTLDNLGQNLVGFEELEKDLAAAARQGFLRTLDGRRIPVGSEHLAIAMLLQGGEAVIMKRAMVLARPHVRRLQARYVLWVHDEFQAESPPTVADHVGEVMVWAMRAAGEHYNLRVRIDGEFQVGETWADTH